MTASMRTRNLAGVLGALLPLGIISSSAFPQAAATDPGAMPTIEIKFALVGAGRGARSGRGILRLPNLGTNCAYPFAVGDVGPGLKVAASGMTVTGAVANLTKVSNLSGTYGPNRDETTPAAATGLVNLKNQENDVVIGLQSHTEGSALSAGSPAMTVQLDEPPVFVAPARSFFLTFGFYKSHLNYTSRATLDRVVQTWKCRYGTILLFGNSDTVGEEAKNLTLSELRAAAAQDYLIRAGIVPARVMVRPRGEAIPAVPTDDNVRLRSNRNVTIVVQD